MNLNLCSLLNICVKMEQENRVVVLIDMDCFYCQVEEKLTPELSGKPIAVVQYNPWKGGGIIAVNYVARAMGVTRHMRGDEAKEKCPEIQLPSVPCFRGKAGISKYRDAGKDVAKVLQKFTPLLERASIDEAYLDITAPVQERLRTHNVNTITADIIPNTYALGYEGINDFISDIHNYGSDSMDFDYEHAKQLLVGALIVTEIRAAVYEKTGYRCSAGIAHNKILAKLVCGMNKPNKQTILPKHSVNILFSTLSVKKVKHLGGKFGDTVCDMLKIKNMSQLQSFSEKELQTRFDEKNGTWLYNIARGIDLEPVQARFNPKSIGCCKQFRGKNALPDLDNLKKWLTDLGDEIDDRLEKDALENNRTPKQMVVSFSTYLPDGRDVSSSRSYNFLPDDDLCGELFFKKALELVLETTEGKFRGEESNRKLKAPIKFLGISVGKFEDNCVDSKKTKKILDYFTAGSSKEITNKSNETKNTRDKSLESTNKSSKNEEKEFILQRFFNTTGIVDQSKDNIFERAQENYVNELVAQSTLEKQESFFAKFLSTGLNTAANDRVESDKHFVENKQSNDILKPSTPTCEVVNCGENSNDTEYSGSTINMEINKSIALFEDDDPQDLERISKIRNLLNSTMIEREEGNNEITTENSSNEDISKVEESDQTIPAIENTYNIFTAEETFECSECRKAVAISNFDTHADYHLALKLREEERHQARLERIDKSSKASSEHNKKPGGLDADNSVPQIRHNETNKTETSSIANFLVKIDNNLPSEICSECGKKVLKEKFLEHLDFHEAQKLNRELNKKPISNAFTGNSAKRKRKSMSPVKKLKVPCKSIDSFFKQ